jgi:Uma2 family endonuclease
MATIPIPPHTVGTEAEDDYPTGDGKPVAETPIHRDNLLGSIQILQRFFADDPLAYVSGNMFVYYEKGNRRKHVSPDVFVALGVPKDNPRDAYFVWQEAHGPAVVIELTSKSTRDEDLEEKMSIYQDKMPVPEYFLFDPKDEYLDPPLQGHRLRDGKYTPIEMVDGRLPSEVLGLHLERNGEWLRYYNPASGLWLPTPEERLAALEERCDVAEAQRERAEAERERAEAERERLSAEVRGSHEEIERLRRELESLRRRSDAQP